jgi:hypothetical protein
MKKYFILYAIYLLPIYLLAQQPVVDSSATSQFIISLNYQSQAVDAGRTYNVKQFSLMPSLTYNHKSGLFAAADGSWFSKSNPAYNLTTVTAGYEHTFNKKFSFTASFSRNFFTNDTAGLIKNQLSAGVTYQKNWFSISADYAYLSGEEKGHLAAFTSAGYWEKEPTKLIDMVAINPTIVFIAGTANVPLRSFSKTIYEQGYQRPWMQRRRPIPRQTNTETAYQFGPMSITAGVPVTVSKGLFALMLSGNIAVPFQLTEEEATELKSQFFISAGISITIN